MEDRKYKILEDSFIIFNGKKLYRIQATENFSEIRKGDIGGYVESPINLAHRGYCWIYDDSIVCGNAHVCENAEVRDKSIVMGDVYIGGYALVSNSDISDNAVLFECATFTNLDGNRERNKVYGKARITSGWPIFGGGADIASKKDFLHVENMGISQDKSVLYYKSNKGNISVVYDGRVYSSISEFSNALKKLYSNSIEVLTEFEHLNRLASARIN